MEIERRASENWHLSGFANACRHTLSAPLDIPVVLLNVFFITNVNPNPKETKLIWDPLGSSYRYCFHGSKLGKVGSIFSPRSLNVHT
jgi:hypothetical protein